MTKPTLLPTDGSGRHHSAATLGSRLVRSDCIRDCAGGGGQGHGAGIAIGEVARDLCRRSVNSGQSYSESRLYAAALDRLSGEVALVEGVTEETAVSELESLVMTKT